ncbi:MAG: hypothetical protein Q8P93_04400 [bacterium]|nr:hypothetical protein [bacterium]
MKTFLFTLFTYAVPFWVFAKENVVKLLEPGVVGGGENATAELGPYLQALFTRGIYIVLSLGVILLMIAGVNYILPTTGTTEEGKKIFYRVVGGIVLALTGYLILNTINPDMVTFKIDKILTPLTLENTKKNTSGGSGAYKQDLPQGPSIINPPSVTAPAPAPGYTAPPKDNKE